MSLLSTLLVTLAGLSLASMVVSWMIARRSAREARTTIFPIVREEETTRARIMTSLTGVVAAIMAGAFFLSGQLPAPTAAPQLVAQGTLPPTETATVAASPTVKVAAPATPTSTPPPPTKPAATLQPALTPTPPPTATSLPATASLASTQPTPDTPTPAPSSPAPGTEGTEGTEAPASLQPTGSVELSQSKASTLVPPGAQIGPIAFSAQVTTRRQPISPTTVFSDTVSRIYAVFPYRGMRDGMTWTQVWYFNGVEFNRGQDTWNWGTADLSYVFTKVVGVGTYRLELYVNNALLSSGEFTVQGPAAIGGPENP